MKKPTNNRRPFTFAALSIFILLVTTGVAQTTTNALTNCFSYADFASTNGLNFVGNAVRQTNFVRLTAAAADQAGAMWYAQKQPCAAGFTTTFRFRISNPVSGGA